MFGYNPHIHLFFGRTGIRMISKCYLGDFGARGYRFHVFIYSRKTRVSSLRHYTTTFLIIITTTSS